MREELQDIVVRVHARELNCDVGRLAGGLVRACSEDEFSGGRTCGTTLCEGALGH